MTHDLGLSQLSNGHQTEKPILGHFIVRLKHFKSFYESFIDKCLFGVLNSSIVADEIAKGSLDRWIHVLERDLLRAPARLWCPASSAPRAVLAGASDHGASDCADARSALHSLGMQHATFWQATASVNVLSVRIQLSCRLECLGFAQLSVCIQGVTTSR